MNPNEIVANTLGPADIDRLVRMGMPDIMLKDLLTFKETWIGPGRYRVIVGMEHSNEGIAAVVSTYFAAACYERDIHGQTWFPDYNFMLDQYGVPDNSSPEAPLVGDRWRMKIVNMTAEGLGSREKAISFILRDLAVQARMVRLGVPSAALYRMVEDYTAWEDRRRALRMALAMNDWNAEYLEVLPRNGGICLIGQCAHQSAASVQESVLTAFASQGAFVGSVECHRRGVQWQVNLHAQFPRLIGESEEITPEEIGMPSIKRVKGIKTLDFVRSIAAAMRSPIASPIHTHGARSVMTDPETRWPWLVMYHVFSDMLGEGDIRTIIGDGLASLGIPLPEITVMPGGYGARAAFYRIKAPEDLDAIGYREFQGESEEIMPGEIVMPALRLADPMFDMRARMADLSKALWHHGYEGHIRISALADTVTIKLRLRAHNERGVITPDLLNDMRDYMGVTLKDAHVVQIRPDGWALIQVDLENLPSCRSVIQMGIQESDIDPGALYRAFMQGADEGTKQQTRDIAAKLRELGYNGKIVFQPSAHHEDGKYLFHVFLQHPETVGYWGVGEKQKAAIATALAPYSWSDISLLDIVHPHNLQDAGLRKYVWTVYVLPQGQPTVAPYTAFV